MKKLLFIALIGLLFTKLDSRFGASGMRHAGGGRGGGRKMNSRKGFSGSKGSRRKGSSSNQKSPYKHGSINNNHINNFGRNNALAGGAWAGGAGWGLLGGISLGMMTGAMIASSGNSKASSVDSNNTTIINNYNSDKKKDGSKFKEASGNIILSTLKIEELSEKLEKELNSLNKKNRSPYIKEYFSPYDKISILSTKSNELYNDNKKDIVKTAIFKGNQEIDKLIKNIRDNVKESFNDIYKNMEEADSKFVDKLKQDLIMNLKILNSNIVEIAEIIMQ